MVAVRDIETPSLQTLFAPASIAVVGASSDPTRIGGRPIQYALKAGFKGAIYPVNPTRDQLQGLTCYPALDALPGPIDLVIVAVPASQVLATLEAAARQGATAAVVFSAGFAEMGGEAVEAQADLHRRARDLGLRVLGPNCLGLYNARLGHTPTFASFLLEPVTPGGRLGLVSQSGAFGSYLFMLANRRGLGIAQWASTGNEMDVSVPDVIAHYAGDPSVATIGCVMEGVRDGRRLMAALSVARRAGKPVVLMKCGRTSAGAQAASTHTASLAVHDEVLDAAVRQAGACRAGTMDELLDVLYGLEVRGPLGGNALGIVSVSGGAGVIMADAATAHGLRLPPMPPALQDELKRANPLATFANPIDITAQALNDISLVERPVGAMLGDAGYDAVAAFFMNYLASPVVGARMRAALGSALAHAGRGTLALVGTLTDALAAEYRAQGILAFEDPARAVATLGALARIGAALGAPERPAPRLGDMPLLDGTEADEAAAKAILARAGIPRLPEVLAGDPGDAGRAAGEIGGPVALKIVSADLPHKTDAGGVRLGLVGRQAVEEAAREMIRSVSRHSPHAKLEGFLVSPMAAGVADLIAAVHADPAFGPVLMVGLGGVFVEVIADTAFRVGAIGDDDARAMLDELRGRKVLDGWRGQPPADVDALAATLSRLSIFGEANAGRFATIEVNPLLALPAGQGAVMLDALISFPGGHHEGPRHVRQAHQRTR